MSYVTNPAFSYMTANFTTAAVQQTVEVSQFRMQPLTYLFPEISSNIAKPQKVIPTVVQQTPIQKHWKSRIRASFAAKLLQILTLFIQRLKRQR